MTQNKEPTLTYRPPPAFSNNPNEAGDTDNPKQEYEKIGHYHEKYLNPGKSELLKFFRLDITFHRAVGNYIYYMDDNAGEIKILDCTSGDNSMTFGHNHPSLVNISQNYFSTPRILGEWAGHDRESVLLSKKINDLLSTRLNENFITAFTNSESEAIEIAKSHAELSHRKALHNTEKNIYQEMLKLTKNKTGSFPDISPELQASLSTVHFLNNTKEIGRLISSIALYNKQQLEKKPVNVHFKPISNVHGDNTPLLPKNKDNQNFNSQNRLDNTSIMTGSINHLENLIYQNTYHFLYLKFDSNDRLEIAETPFCTISTLLVNPVCDENSIQIISNDTLKSLREICTQHNIHLIFNETHSGMGRTGYFLATENSGVTADYYLLEQNLAGGITHFGAVIIREKVYEYDFGLMQITNSRTNNFGSALSLQCLNLLESENILKHVQTSGQKLINDLKKIKESYPDIIKEIKGVGFTIDIEFSNFSNFGSAGLRYISTNGQFPLVLKGYLLYEHRIKVSAPIITQNVIQLRPSVYFNEDESTKVLRAIHRLCEALHKQNMYELMKFIVYRETYELHREIQNFRKPEKNFNTTLDENRIAFIGHFINASHLSHWDESYSLFSASEMKTLFQAGNKFNPPAFIEKIHIKSPTGDTVELNFIAIMMDSEMIIEDMKSRKQKIFLNKINTAVDMAINTDCKVVGFGGFCAIATNNCKNLISDKIKFTTGNSFITAIGIESILHLANEKSITLKDSCFAAVGPAGNISQVYVEILSEKISNLILIQTENTSQRSLTRLAGKVYEHLLNILKEDLLNNTKESTSSIDHPILNKIMETQTVKEFKENQFHSSKKEELKTNEYREFLYKSITDELKDEAPIIISSNMNDLRKAKIILASNSSPKKTIFPEHLSKAPVIICDITSPHSTDDSVEELCKNVTIIHGGIVKLPLNDDFSIRGLPLNKGQTHACIAETILLGLNKINENYSYGNTSSQKVKKIEKIAAIHGFKLGNYKIERSF